MNPDDPPVRVGLEPNGWDLQHFQENRDFGLPAPAKIKILHPLLTTSPPSDAEILGFADGHVRLRVSIPIVVGAAVQIRSGERVSLGRVICASPTGPEFEIEVMER